MINYVFRASQNCKHALKGKNIPKYITYEINFLSDSDQKDSNEGNSNEENSIRNNITRSLNIFVTNKIDDSYCLLSESSALLPKSHFQCET